MKRTRTYTATFEVNLFCSAPYTTTRKFKAASLEEAQEMAATFAEENCSCIKDSATARMNGTVGKYTKMTKIISVK